MAVSVENVCPYHVCVIATEKDASCAEGTMTLMEAMSDKRVKIGFRKFLESEFSVENLDFWEAVEAYKRIKDNDTRERRAKEIYDEYISHHAARQINLDSHKRQQIIKRMSDGSLPTKCIFNAAQRYNFNVMENDSYPRFLQSNCYQICTRSGRRSPRRFLQDILRNTTPPRSRSNSLECKLLKK